MLFGLVRLLILIVFVLIFMLLIKFGIVKRKKITLVVALCIGVLIYSVLAYWPFENLFFRFPTAESAFRYTYSHLNIYKVITDNDIAVIAYGKEKNSEQFAILERDKSGWPILPFMNPENGNGGFYKLYSINTVKSRSGKKELIAITNSTSAIEHNRINKISDNINSKFSRFEVNMFGGPNITDYTLINIPASNYYLYINGEKVDINSML